MAIQRMLSTFQGEDKPITFTIHQPGTLTAQNITGWSLSFAMSAIDDDDILISKTTGAGIVLTTPLSGICTLTLSPADTADLDPDALYRYELRRTDTGSDRVLFYGRFRVADSVH